MAYNNKVYAYTEGEAYATNYSRYSPESYGKYAQNEYAQKEYQRQQGQYAYSRYSPESYYKVIANWIWRFHQTIYK